MDRFKHFNVLLLILAVVYVITLFIPGVNPHCMLKTQTGLSCPGCGATHSFIALTQGNIFSAVQYNALFLPVMGMGLVGTYNYWKNGEFLPEVMQTKTFAWIVAIVVFIYTILRNIPNEAFDFLRP